MRILQHIIVLWLLFCRIQHKLCFCGKALAVQLECNNLLMCYFFTEQNPLLFQSQIKFIYGADSDGHSEAVYQRRY